MAEKTRIPSSRLPYQAVYPWLIFVTGLGLLVWSSFFYPASRVDLLYGLVCLLFVALQINLPFRFLSGDAYLVHVTALGTGLLAGGVTAGWAVTLGILGGYGIRYFLSQRVHAFKGFTNPGLIEAGFTVSRVNLALLLALLVTGFMEGVTTRPDLLSLPAARTALLSPLLLFALLHGLIYLLGFFPHWREDTGASGRDLLSLALFELTPVPFIMAAVLSYPSIQIGSLLILASSATLTAGLVFRANNAHIDLQRRLQELSTLNQVSQVLRSSLDLEQLLATIQLQVTRLLAVDNFYVALYDADEKKISYPLAVRGGKRDEWPARKLENRLTDRVILERKPLIINRSTPKEIQVELAPSQVTPTAWIGVPLIASDRAIGCLALFSIQAGDTFSQTDLNLLLILSGPISVATENALLYEQAQRRSAQLETLNQISKLITASLDPQEVLKQVCESVALFSRGRRAAIYLIDSQENRIWLAHAQGLSARFTHQNQFFSIAQNGRTQCLRTGQPWLVSALTPAGLESEFFETLEQEKIQAYGDFPLTTPEGQIGFLSVYFEQQHEFTREEIELLQTFASQAALAVSNASLYARTDLALSQRVNQLSVLEALGRELAAAMPTGRLFEMILDYALQFTNSPWGSLGLYEAENQKITLRAMKGYQGTLDQFSLDSGISGRAIHSRQAVISGDVYQEPDYIDVTGGQARSQISIPLIHQGEVVGVLTLESPQTDAYTQVDLPFMRQIANQAAVALANARLYSETQRRLREQMTLYTASTGLAGELELDNILQTIDRALGDALDTAIETGIYLWEDTTRSYRLRWKSQDLRTAEAGEQVTGAKDSCFASAFAEEQFDFISRAMSLSEPIYYASGQAPAGICEHPVEKALLILPLIFRGQPLGVILLHPASKELAIDQQKQQLVQAISAQASLSIQNALLFADVSHGRDRLAAVINSVNEGILMASSDGSILLANESVQKLTGVDFSDLIGKNFASLEPQVLDLFGFSQAEIQSLIQAVAEGQFPQVSKSVLKVSELNPDQVMERISLPVLGQSGQVIGWMMVLRDISEENRIAQAREFITETIVHDLRSPLGAVMGAIDIAREELSLGDQNREIALEALNVGNRGARRILGLVDSLMDISKMEAGKMELNLSAVDIQQQVDAVLADFVQQSSEYKLALLNEIPAGLPKVKADPDKLSRILTNLVDNALKFTPEGGEISLKARPDEAGMLLVQVSDTGPGIPEGFQDKVFERFSRIPKQSARRKGSGLGLNFCRLAVEAQGGRIFIESRPGGGSVFCFTLPLARED